MFPSIIYNNIVKMSKKLEVPYRSQEDNDARIATTDCGATCVAMLLGGFGRFEKIDDVFRLNTASLPERRSVPTAAKGIASSSILRFPSLAFT